MGSMMKFSFLILFFSLFTTLALASKKSYIVYLGGHSHGRDASLTDHERATDSHNEFLGLFLGSEEEAKEAIFYSYNKHINGFAAFLEEEEAKKISKHPNVISVFPDKLIPIHTTRTWQFLSLVKDNGDVPPYSGWSKARYGDDVIIGNIDTGVWPESESFNDSGLGPVPTRWRGSCQNNTKSGVPCNKKLIGAKYYNKGYDASSTFDSTRDIEGHGTHTLSTAGGSFVQNASILDCARGTAGGGSPAARVAAYKVCAEEGCLDSAIMAGIDDAIYDGVDILSLSLGGDPAYYFEDSMAISTFHAVKEGIVVVASAGNSGPSSYTVSNVAPWMFTVAASSVDRDFPTDVILGEMKQKDSRHVEGQSITDKALPEKKSYPLIKGTDAAIAGDEDTKGNATLCVEGMLDPKKVKGKIVVCLRGVIARAEKGVNVLQAGGLGMLLVNSEVEGNDVTADLHFLPAAHLTYAQGVDVYSYVNSTKSPVGYIGRPQTRYGYKPAPSMASFSSRGPNLVNEEILKPDVTAPGINILASFPSNIPPTGFVFDTRRTNFELMSGTSMSCPHVAGIAGLVKAKYPHWSPAAIRSAIMTTATTKDNTGKTINTDPGTEATPFEFGAGHVQPNNALDPGLVYDLSTKDYLNFLCSNNYTSEQLALFSDSSYKCPTKPAKLENMNYPSITVLNLEKSTKVTRTLKNVGGPGKYSVHVQQPTGVQVSVKPSQLKFDKIGEEKTFEITFTLSKGHVCKGEFAFGEMAWCDGKHDVRSPLVVQSGV